ncbi:hypothetical protein H0H81_006510 [Sphagnurus paluster]|uniref:Uncharacterized protein n=1 Tax=Sphagnurus paluster TaxID=117069 RepID=A0A9P7FTA6_9AGAR|nr:hypothetical protein H0H81_006510 [Sphagnurus paluster]
MSIDCLNENDFETIKHKLWRNNARPTPHAKKTLEALLSRVLDEIADVDADILRLQLEMDHLLKRMNESTIMRQEKETTASTYKARLSAITELHEFSFMLQIPTAAASTIENLTEERPTLHFPHLTTLKIQTYASTSKETEPEQIDLQERSLAEVLSNIQFPALKHLQLICTPRPDFPESMDIIFKSLQPWLVSLRRLAIVYNLIDVAQLSEILSPCRNLELLAIYPNNYSQVDSAAILRKLYPAPESPQIKHPFPRLTNFVAYLACDTIEKSESAAVEFKRLLCAWAQDPSRERLVESVGFYIRDDEKNHDAHRLVLEKLESELSGSGFTLVTNVFKFSKRIQNDFFNVL